MALVTGSRAGLGKFIATEFVTRGFRVVGCSRNKSGWSLDRYEHIETDVSDEKQVISLLRHVRRVYGRLDVTINNAGIASMNHSLLMPGATVERILGTNVLGTFVVSRESAKLMQRSKWGRIVNLSSVAVPMRTEGEAVYAASKGAIEVLTRVLAREFAAFGVTVNAVGPSPVDTELIRHVPEDSIRQLLNRLAVRQMAKPEDVMNVIDFFTRPESGSITGQVIYLGGA